MANRLCHSWARSILSSMLLGVAGCQRQPTSRPQPQPQPASRLPSQPPSAPVSPQPKREPIFFIPGDGTLSPGALIKLKTWVETWGVKGKWTLGCPTGPGLPYDLMEKRVQAIRAELRKFGVLEVETILLPAEPPGPYDAIYVEMTPA